MRKVILSGFKEAIDFARVYTIIQKYELSVKYGKKMRKNALYLEFEGDDGECTRYGIYLRDRNYMVFKED